MKNFRKELKEDLQGIALGLLMVFGLCTIVVLLIENI
jgi:hypothetical protein